jgi:hypothetical protein
MTNKRPAISQSAGRKPTRSSNNPPTKKPMPFMAFFEPVNHATQRNSWPLPSAEVALMADLDAVLVTSLATPAMPCATTTQATEAAAVQPGSSKESMTRPTICRAWPTASIRGMPKRAASQPPPRLAAIPAAS